jgi:hypothetical protein
VLTQGVFAQAVGTYVRLAVMATHRSEELRAAARVLGDAARAIGFDPRATVVYAEPEAEYFEPDEHDQPEQTGPFDYERIAHAA